MTHAEQYAKLSNPAPVKVLGRRLADYSPKHEGLLNEVGYNAANVSPVDLLLALRVCSLPAHKAHKALGRRVWNARDFVTLLAFRFVDGLFAGAVAAFQEYLETAKPHIPFRIESESTKRGTCPPLLTLYRDLCRFWHYTPEQVDAMPYGKAEYQRLAILEADGVLEFVTEADKHAYALAEEFAKKEAAGEEWHAPEDLSYLPQPQE